MVSQNTGKVNRIRLTPDECATLVEFLAFHRAAAEKAIESAAVAARIEEMGAWAEGSRRYYKTFCKVCDYLVTQATNSLLR
jgi:hypothetical protein